MINSGTFFETGAITARHPVYEVLMKEVTDDLEKKVLDALIERAGERVTRPELVLAVFGNAIESRDLANNPDDRRIREAIERLQRQDFPILASSGQAGYALAADEAILDSYIGEIISRQVQLKEKEAALRRSRRWVRFIKEYKVSRATQINMFAKPTVLP